MTDLREPAVLVALAAGVLALIALVTTLVLATRLRRVRAAQMVVLGDSGRDDVVVEIQPETGEAIRVRRTVDTVAQGQTAEVSLPLENKPAAGQAVTITATVRPVRGEEKTDNNELEFKAAFVEG